MKKYILICLIPILSFAQETTFILDSNFEQLLIDWGYDTDLDNYVLTESIDTITTLEIAGYEISDLTGLEDFSNLTYLYCYSNNLSELNVSSNLLLQHLYCSNNNLSELDISNNTALTYLSCDNNNIGELNLSNNPEIVSLICFDNNISELNLSSNSELTTVSCDNNNLSELDLSNNPNLTYLNCFNNNISELDLSANNLLSDLYCYSNNLSELDISNNTQLKNINCASNNLSFLNTSFNTMLTYLNCSWNDLSTINIGNNNLLNHLSCYGNMLAELDLSNNPALTDLYCYLNNLASLNVSNNNLLNNLWCYDNNIDCIEVWDLNYAISSQSCESDNNCFKKDDNAVWSLNCNCPQDEVSLTLYWENGLNTNFNVEGDINGLLFSDSLTTDSGFLTACWPINLQADCFTIDIESNENFLWQFYSQDVLILEGTNENTMFGVECANGCMDTNSCNYDLNALVDDGACLNPGDECVLEENTGDDFEYGILDENCECINTLNIFEEPKKTKQLLNTIDVLGRQNNNRVMSNTKMLLNIYHDGSVEKLYQF